MNTPKRLRKAKALYDKIKNSEDICIICTKSDNLQSLFQYKSKISKESMDLSQKLKDVCNVDVDENASMPTHICGICFSALIVAYDLITLCKHSNNLLRKCIELKDKQSDVINSTFNSNNDQTIIVDLVFDKNNEKSNCENLTYDKNNDKCNDENLTYDKNNDKCNDENLTYDKNNDKCNDENLTYDKSNDEDLTYYDMNNDKSDDEDLRNRNAERSIVEYSEESNEIDNERFNNWSNDENVNKDVQSIDECVDKMLYNCYGCYKSFITTWDREEHEIICPNISAKTKYNCKVCPATAIEREILDEHIWFKHKQMLPPIKQTKPTGFICEVCGNKYKNFVALKTHQKTHQPRKVHQCEQCSYHTTSRHSYTLHMRTVHLGYPLFECDHCSYKTARKDSLKIHFMIHTGERKFFCRFCKFTAVNQSNLKRHMLTHTNVRDYVCDTCGSAFKTKRDLKKHTWSVHQNIKRWYCKLCKCKYSCFGEVLKKKHLKTKHGVDSDSNPDCT